MDSDPSSLVNPVKIGWHEHRWAFARALRSCAERARRSECDEIAALDRFKRREKSEAPGTPSDHAFWLHTPLAQGGEAVRTVAFGQALSVGVIHKRKVPPACMHAPQAARDDLLSRRACKEIIAADHIGYAMPGVVDNHGQLIRGNAELRPKHEVASFEPGVEHVLAEEFIENRLRRRLDEETMVGVPAFDGCRPRCRRTEFGREARLAILRVGCARRASDFGSGAVAWERRALRRQRREGFAVGDAVVRLHFWRAVPVELEPANVLERGLVGAWFDTTEVEILKAEDDAPILVPRQRPRRDECVGITDVKRPGWRWRKARG